VSNPQERKERGKSDYLESEDGMGRVVDFPSLRHGFITYLVTANVPPKGAKMLARHSTISLTMDRYTHLGIVDLVAGLKLLPVTPGGNGAGRKCDMPGVRVVAGKGQSEQPPNGAHNRRPRFSFVSVV